MLPSIGVRWFRKGGGMPPLTLAPVSGRYLSFTEREEITVLLAGGCGVREIERRLGRAPSTISRELQRNAAIGRGRVEYRASTAHRHAERRARRPKPAKLAVNPQLRAYVQDRLSGTVQRPDGSVAGPDIAWRGRRQGPRKDRRWGQCWSPEQISGRLRLDFPDDESMRVSHEAIYQSLYIQGRGALRRELSACLRTGRALRAPRNRTSRGNRSFVTDELLISERPAEVDDRAVPGTLGRRSDPRHRSVGDRHSGRAVKPVHDAVTSPADRRSQHPKNDSPDRRSRVPGPAPFVMRSRTRSEPFPNSCDGP